ncbi:MAG TPA: MOSC domain-containing protein, partial [Deltaproteobacteria bacterium]|nr:MOSC domain-containing protein [Deltaproteobacteria bacterium]
MPQPRLSALTIYPIKSCAALALTQARVTLRGLEHDRRWLIVDAHSEFCTQRKFPHLALVQPCLDGNRLVLSTPEQSELELPLVPDSGKPEHVQVW